MDEIRVFDSPKRSDQWFVIKYCNSWILRFLHGPIFVSKTYMFWFSLWFLKKHTSCLVECEALSFLYSKWCGGAPYTTLVTGMWKWLIFIWLSMLPFVTGRSNMVSCLIRCQFSKKQLTCNRKLELGLCIGVFDRTNIYIFSVYMFLNANRTMYRFSCSFFFLILKYVWI